MDIIRENKPFSAGEFPNAFRNNQNPSLLDLVMVNHGNLSSSIKQHPPLCKSDHITLHSILQLKFPASCSRSLKTIKITDYRQIYYLEEVIDWSAVVLPITDIDTLHGLMDECSILRDIVRMGTWYMY